MERETEITRYLVTISIRELAKIYVRTSGVAMTVEDIVLKTDDFFNDRLDITVAVDADLAAKAIQSLIREEGNIQIKKYKKK